MTGIPAHIITCVNQERIITNMNTKFNEYTYAGELKNELDARQMGGTSTLTLELIRNETIHRTSFKLAD